MCMLNFTPFDSEEADYPLPRGRPRLAWAVPVNMSELGASLQVIVDTVPQTSTLRLCHCFGKGLLSRLPQELLEQIIDQVQSAARVDRLPEWYQDSVCWQGTCLLEDHYSAYNENVEKLWQKIFVEEHYSPTHTRKDQDKGLKVTEKLEMVHSWMCSNPRAHMSEEGWSFHFDARYRWVDRTCACPEEYSTTTRNIGIFTPLQKILKTHFGLEAMILHEVLSPAMYEFLPNTNNEGDYVYYTACYLALPGMVRGTESTNDGKPAPNSGLFEGCGVHTAFSETLEPSLLSISDKQRCQFVQAMKRLNIEPCYHLSRLEPHIIHPVEDEDIMDICSCRKRDCPGEWPDIHSWDRPSCLEQILESRSKEMAKESWLKLMHLAASDAVTPCAWED